MREEYDFSGGRKNPYAKMKKQITINIDADTILYFKQMAAQNGIPYQVLMNAYLSDCAKNHKELKLLWA